MSSWIGQAARRGILTSQYPARSAEAAEVPLTARGPRREDAGSREPFPDSRCPVDAIENGAVDLGRCIRCARCLPAGFRFSGPVEASLAPKRESPSAGVRASSPLASLGRSVHALLVDVGSCNACNLEVLGLATPFYDSSRLGIFFTNSPRHADVLVVVGVPTEAMIEPLRRAYDALPGPKAVLAVGVCPMSGGAFRGNAGLRPSLDSVVPVDLAVPGCPPTPIQILDGILTLAGRGRKEG